jgi:hypothetical protein
MLLRRLFKDTVSVSFVWSENFLFLNPEGDFSKYSIRNKYYLFGWVIVNILSFYVVEGDYLKGQCHEIFDPRVFHQSKPLGPLIHGLKPF